MDRSENFTRPMLADFSDEEVGTTTATARTVASAEIGAPPQAATRSLSSTPHQDRESVAGLGRPARQPQYAFCGAVPPSAIGDMKAGLTSDRPKLSLMPTQAELYAVRALEYGAEKYKRGNYHGKPPAGVVPQARTLGYIDAAIRHLRKVSRAYNRSVGTGGDGIAAISVTDDVSSGNFPASRLPDLAHAAASIALAIECAVDDALLPEDPGQPWKRPGAPSGDDRSPEAVARFQAAAGMATAADEPSSFAVTDDTTGETVAAFRSEDDANVYLFERPDLDLTIRPRFTRLG